MAKSVGTRGVKIVGDKEIMAILTEIAPKEAQRLARTTIYGIAARVTKGAKARVKVKTGALRKSIYTKSEKSHPDKPMSSVRFRDSGYYWRFVEYGTKHHGTQEFLKPARLEVMSNLKTILREEFQKKLTSRIKAAIKKQASKNGV
jgi:HK97 gp10 family phage protein